MYTSIPYPYRLFPAGRGAASAESLTAKAASLGMKHLAITDPGIFFASKFEDLDHWIAFTLLGCIGGKMIKDCFSKEDGEEERDKSSFGFVKMLILAVATSIEALAVGTTFAFFKVNIYMAIAITGPVTFFIATGGVIIGNIFGTRFKSKAEFSGGAVLIIIGIKIVIEHLFF